jgi:hypothetical protein
MKYFHRTFRSPMKCRQLPRSAIRSQGFALILSLSLMAFILLLLLSVSTLVRVETVNAKQQLSQLKAKTNALLGS